MTNKTEDRFYFGKPGQPERFENAPWMSEVNSMLRDLGRERAKIKIWISGSNSVTTAASSRGDLRSGGFTFLVGGRMADYLRRAVPGATMQHTEQRDYPKKGLWTSFYKVSNLPKELIAYLKNWGIGTTPQAFSGFTGASAVAYSRPGQPERFGLEDACWDGYEPVGTKQKDGRTVPNCVPKDKNEQPEEFGSDSPRIKAMESQLSDWIKQRDLLLKDIKRNPNDERAQRHLTRVRQEIDALVTQIDNAKRAASFSRPGQPERFDASSLDRGNFAEASKSPMLGKLLAAKVMPDGGWRAVQVGSDTLVISFEDADLARDFGRRASTKGYSATSPVATTGRYWNVEVKNG